MEVLEPNPNPLPDVAVAKLGLAKLDPKTLPPVGMIGSPFSAGVVATGTSLSGVCDCPKVFPKMEVDVCPNAGAEVWPNTVLAVCPNMDVPPTEDWPKTDGWPKMETPGAGVLPVP